MAKIYEDECIRCTTMGLPCLGSSCSKRNVPYWFCDECKEYVDPSNLYKYEEKELCADCLLEKFETVEKE